MDKFNGFVRPKTNYFRMPNNWTDITYDMTSLAEMKVVEYVLRHTWGYVGQEDRPRRISVNEFICGRKKKGGGRIDRGTGLSAGSVSTGLKSAIEHGYLEMLEDKTDGGRVKRSYSLIIFDKLDRSEFEGLGSEFEGIDFKLDRSEFGGEGSEFGGEGSEFGGRTWKDNKGKDNKGERQPLSLSEPLASDRTSEVPSLSDEGKQTRQPSSPESNVSSRRRKKKYPSAFDVKAANKFAEVVKSHRKVQKNSDLRQWANTFRQMRETDKVPEKDIREMIMWYGKYIGGDFIPEAFSAATFRKKYAEGKFTAAMRRCSQGNGTSSNGGKRLTRENMWSDPENVLPGGILKTEVGQDGQKYDGQLLYRVRQQVLKRFGQGLPLFEELQTVLDEEFPGVETLPVAIIGRVG